MRKSAAALLLLFLLPACDAAEHDGGTGGQPCEYSTDVAEPCGTRAVCELDAGSSAGTCRELVACAPDGGCPDGEGLCNDGRIDALDDGVCVPYRCAEDADCPAAWRCVIGSSVVGLCFEVGTEGGVCLDESECEAGLDCVVPYHGADFRICAETALDPDGSCDFDYQCQTGEYCNFLGACAVGSGYGCKGNLGCPEGEICDPTEAACRRP